MPQPPGTSAADPQIAPLVVRNVSAFRALISTLQDDQLPVGEGDQVSALKDDQAIASSHLARFKLWAMSLGAHRPSGGRSLEYRLRDASLIRNHVISLLQDLSRAVDEGTAAAAKSNIQDGSRSESIEDELADYFQESGSEMDQILNEIGHVVDCLLRLSITISNPTPHDQFKSRVGVETVEIFKEWYTKHVLEKFGQTDAKTADRLGNAMARRRQYFQYREDHSNRLAEGLDGDDLDHDLQATTIASSIPKHLKESRESAMKEFAGLDDNRSEISRTSYAPSIANSDQIQVPPLPKEHADGPFKCPFCHMIVSIETRHDWKKHVFRDLRPYVCLSKTCQTPDQQFSRRGDWSRHMIKEHWITWQCSFGCPGEFHTVDDFRKHTKTNHGQEVPHDKIDILESLSINPEPSKAETTCPLCLTFQVTSAQQYASHVGTHLEQLALFTLPRQEYDGAGDDDSEGMQNNSKNSVRSGESEDLEAAAMTGDNNKPDTEPHQASSRTKSAESLTLEHQAREGNRNEANIGVASDATPDGQDRLVSTDGHPKGPDADNVNPAATPWTISFQDIVQKGGVIADEESESEMPALEDDNSRGYGPSVDPNSSRLRSGTIDYGDDGYTYTTPADLFRHDLNFTQSLRHPRRGSFDRGHHRSHVDHEHDEGVLGVESSRDKGDSGVETTRGSFETRGDPASIGYTSLYAGDIHVMPSSARSPWTPGPIAVASHASVEGTLSPARPSTGATSPPPPILASAAPKIDSDIFCEICGWRPKGDPRWFRGSMAKHKKLQHSATTTEVYRCPYPGCTRQYKGPDNLRQHQIDRRHFLDRKDSSPAANRSDPIAMTAPKYGPEAPSYDLNTRFSPSIASNLDQDASRKTKGPPPSTRGFDKIARRHDDPRNISPSEGSRSDWEGSRQDVHFDPQSWHAWPEGTTASDLDTAGRTASNIPVSNEGHDHSESDSQSQRPIISHRTGEHLDTDGSEVNVSSSGEKHQTRDVPTHHEEEDKPLPKSILKTPKASFPEDPNPIREGVAPHKNDGEKANKIPPGAKWTKISRTLINPEALTIGKERFEVRDDFVIVLRVLSKEEIQAYANATQVLRERRRRQNTEEVVQRAEGNFRDKAEIGNLEEWLEDYHHRRGLDNEHEAENEERL